MRVPRINATVSKVHTLFNCCILGCYLYDLELVGLFENTVIEQVYYITNRQVLKGKDIMLTVRPLLPYRIPRPLLFKGGVPLKIPRLGVLFSFYRETVYTPEISTPMTPKKEKCGLGA